MWQSEIRRPNGSFPAAGTVPYSTFVVGRFNANDVQLSFTPDSSIAPVTLDGGSAFIFPEVGYRQRDGQSVLVAGGWVRTPQITSQGIACWGMGYACAAGASIVRELTWDDTLLSLLSVPVPEVESLRGEVLYQAPQSGGLLTPQRRTTSALVVQSYPWTPACHLRWRALAQLQIGSLGVVLLLAISAPDVHPRLQCTHNSAAAGARRWQCDCELCPTGG